MKLLVVSEAYPPSLDPGALSVGKLVHGLIEAGHDVRVVTTQVGDGMAAGPMDTSACWGEVLKAAVRVPGPRRIPRLLLGAAARAWGRLPGAGAWIYAAYRTAAAMAARERFDCVLTGYVPFRTALVGRALKRAYGLPWVARFPDPSPWCLYPPPYGPGRPVTVRDRYVVARTRRLLRDLDALIAPSRRMADYLDAAFGGVVGDRAIVLPHIGWSRPAPQPPAPQAPASQAPASQPPAPRSPAPPIVRLLHPGIRMHGRESGELARTLRGALTEARARGIPVRLTFSGYVSGEKTLPARLAGLEEFVEWAPAAAYEDSLAQMAGATALLLVEAVMQEGIFMPSKVGDYAASGRPVLMFSPPRGTVADLVGGLGHPGFLTQDPEVAVPRLVAFLQQAAAGASLEAYRIPDPARFEPSRIVGTLMDGIGRFCAAAPRSAPRLDTVATGTRE